MRLVVGVLQVADLTAAFDQYSGETYDYDSFIELIAPILVLVLLTLVLRQSNVL